MKKIFILDRFILVRDKTKITAHYWNVVHNHKWFIAA